MMLLVCEAHPFAGGNGRPSAEKNAQVAQPVRIYRLAWPIASTAEPRLQEGERPVPALKLGEMAHLRVPQMLQGRHRELLLVIYSHREEPQRCSHRCFAQRQYRFFLQAVGSVLRQVRLA